MNVKDKLKIIKVQTLQRPLAKDIWIYKYKKRLWSVTKGYEVDKVAEKRENKGKIVGSGH